MQRYEQGDGGLRVAICDLCKGMSSCECGNICPECAPDILPLEGRIAELEKEVAAARGKVLDMALLLKEEEARLAEAKTKAARWDALMGEGRVHVWNRIPPQYGMERAWTTIHTGAFVQSVYDSPEALADALIEEEG